MSIDTKKEFLPFDYTDLDAVARHFEEKAEEGWMLKIFDNTVVYERCEPKELRFNVALCPIKGSENTNISKESQGFIDFCEETGWDFVDHRGGAYAFCTDDKSLPDIVTDERERIEAVRKAGSRRRLISSAFGGLTLSQLLIRVISAFTETDIQVKNAQIAIAIFFGAALILLAAGIYLSEKRVGRWIGEANAAIEEGWPIPESDENVLRQRKTFAIVAFALLASITLALLTYALFTISPDARCFMSAMLLAAIPLAFVPRIFRKKRSKAAKAAIIIALIIGYIFLMLVIFGILGEIFQVFPAE